MKKRILHTLVVLFAFVGWVIYEEGGWTEQVTLSALSMVTFIVTLFLCVYAQKVLLKKGFEPAFPFIIVMLLSMLALGLSDVEFSMPFEVGIEAWHKTPMSNVTDWFLSSLALLSFSFALSKPNNNLQGTKNK